MQRLCAWGIWEFQSEQGYSWSSIYINSGCCLLLPKNPWLLTRSFGYTAVFCYSSEGCRGEVRCCRHTQLICLQAELSESKTAVDYSAINWSVYGIMILLNIQVVFSRELTCILYYIYLNLKINKNYSLASLNIRKPKNSVVAIKWLELATGWWVTAISGTL